MGLLARVPPVRFSNSGRGFWLKNFSCALRALFLSSAPPFSKFLPMPLILPLLPNHIQLTVYACNSCCVRMCIALDDHESEGWLVAMLAVLSLIKNKVGWYGALFKSEVPSGEILQCGGKISASVYCSMSSYASGMQLAWCMPNGIIW